ncbi:hypothetical protein ILP97_00465 [Amycolatopsis sp. H6(2020)]|nr:hypothetical protein [Amycolatopsis sp. H6(2020)]
MALVVFNRDTRVASFGYRIWASRTSFYIKNRDIDLGVKISVHGPDPRHDQPGFKFGVDGKAASLLHDSVAWRFEEGAQMGWFPGAEVVSGVRHLVRIRFTWNSFQHGSPSGPQPSTSKEVGQHLLIEAPPLLKAADIDLYLSDTGKPYWPNEQKARRDNATLGPLENDAGQILTAVSWRRSLLNDPATAELEALAKPYGGPRIRTLASNRDETGFLWVREVIAPQAMLRKYDETELRAATAIPPQR